MNEEIIGIEFGDGTLLEFSNIRFIDDFIKFKITVRNNSYHGSTIFMTDTDIFERLLNFCESTNLAISDKLKICKSKYEQESYIEFIKLDNIGHYQITAFIAESDNSQFAKVIIPFDQSSFSELTTKIRAFEKQV